MKKIVFLLVFISMGLLITSHAMAQLRQFPEAVKDAFEQKYPDVKEVNYEDKIVYVLAHFKRDEHAATAKYTSKGAWQWTETEIAFSALPGTVQDGFNKSKYMDWQIDKVYTVDLPGGALQYKLQVEKSAVQKKNLSFNKRGRLLSDRITMY